MMVSPCGGLPAIDGIAEHIVFLLVGASACFCMTEQVWWCWTFLIAVGNNTHLVYVAILSSCFLFSLTAKQLSIKPTKSGRYDIQARGCRFPRAGPTDRLLVFANINRHGFMTAWATGQKSLRLTPHSHRRKHTHMPNTKRDFLAVWTATPQLEGPSTLSSITNHTVEIRLVTAHSSS